MDGEKVTPVARVLLVFVTLVLLLSWQAGSVAQAEGLAKPLLVSDSSSNQYISAGDYHTCGLKVDGSIVCWGDNTYGQLSVPAPNSNFTQVSAGYYHTCGLGSYGGIYCWGWDWYGQVSDRPLFSDFTQVSAGYYHTCSLTIGGIVVCWGDNTYGQLTVPAPNSNFTQVSAGHYHTCGLKNDTSIACWGDNTYGRLTVPAPNSNFTQVSAGVYHTCGLKSDGGIVCWGSDSRGQVSGNPNTTDFTQVSTGYFHTCGLKNDGGIYCWGWNYYGQVSGNPFTTDFTQVSAGPHHTCGLKNDTSIVCWGDDDHGQTFVPAPNTNFGLASTPTVVSINSLPDTGDGQLTDGESTALGIIQILVTFNVDVVGRMGASAANNPNNYLLFSDGGDGFDTVDCAGGVAVGDASIPISTVSYDDQDGYGPFVATVTLNGGTPLPPGEYRFLVCGTTSVRDASGRALNGGADEVLSFTISGGGSTNGGNGGAGKTAALPATGFAPGRITALPMQSPEKAYTASDMWMEIPRLGVKMDIVGVPVVNGEWDVSWLGSSAGWMEGTAFPTYAGNTGITAHVWDADNNPGPFLHLKRLRHGDVVEIHAWGYVYTYSVRYNYLVRPDNPYVMQHEDYDWITLLTCESYNRDLDTYRFRRVVRAVLVDVRFK